MFEEFLNKIGLCILTFKDNTRWKVKKRVYFYTKSPLTWAYLDQHFLKISEALEVRVLKYYLRSLQLLLWMRSAFQTQTLSVVGRDGSLWVPTQQYSEQNVSHISQFVHCQHAFVSGYVVLMKDDFFLQAKLLVANFNIQSVKKITVIFNCNCCVFSR